MRQQKGDAIPTPQLFAFIGKANAVLKGLLQVSQS